MSAAVTHGVRRGARILRVVKFTAPNGAQLRLADHQRRALGRLQRQLDTEPLEAVRDSLIVSIANGRLLCEQADAALLVSSDLRQETGLAKFSGWLHNRLRRDCELLLLVEQKRRDSETTPNLSDYLASKATTATAAPAAGTEAAVDTEPAA